MPDVPFIHGSPAKLQLKIGAGATMNLACVGGTGYRIARNNRIPMLAQGNAFGASPANLIPGIETTVLNVVAYPFEAAAVPANTGWFSADNIAAMLARDANGDLPFVDVSFTNGVTAATDQMKLASFRMSLNGATNEILCDLTFIGKNAVSAAAFGAFVASGGTPLYFKDAGLFFIPVGGVSAPVYGWESCQMTIATGARVAKFGGGAEAANKPSHVDVGTLSGGFTVAQRAGAATRLDAQNAGRMGITIVGPGGEHNFQMGVDRIDKNAVMNPGGSVGAPTSWQYYAGADALLGVLNIVTV